jgi:hypothetical protein
MCEDHVAYLNQQADAILGDLRPRKLATVCDRNSQHENARQSLQKRLNFDDIDDHAPSILPASRLKAPSGCETFAEVQWAYDNHAIGAARRRSRMTFANDKVVEDSLQTIADKARDKVTVSTPRSHRSPIPTSRSSTDSRAQRSSSSSRLTAPSNCATFGEVKFAYHHRAMGASERQSQMSFANDNVAQDNLQTIAQKAASSARSSSRSPNSTPHRSTPKLITDPHYAHLRSPPSVPQARSRSQDSRQQRFTPVTSTPRQSYGKDVQVQWTNVNPREFERRSPEVSEYDSGGRKVRSWGSLEASLHR